MKLRIGILVILVLLLTLAFTAKLPSNDILPVYGQAGANQKITIEGLQTEGRGQQLELQSYQWGSASQSNLKQLTLSPPSSEIFNPKEMTITKLVDASTPELMVACFAGKEYPEMVLKVAKILENGDHEVFYTITLQKGRITGCSQEGSQSNPPTEEISFVFEKIVFKYVTPDGNASVRGWDFKTKKELCLPPGGTTPLPC